MLTSSKVGRERAMQLTTRDDESPRSNPVSYPTHFICKMDEEIKTKFNSWSIEKCCIQAIRNKPVGIRVKSVRLTESNLDQHQEPNNYSTFDCLQG